MRRWNQRFPNKSLSRYLYRYIFNYTGLDTAKQEDTAVCEATKGITAYTANGIYLWNGGVLAVGGVLFLLAVLPYNLSSARYCQIVKELDTRKSAENS